MRYLLALSLALSSLLSQAQQPAAKAAPSKPAKPARSPQYKLQDSNKVIFDAIAAMDRYEAYAEKPPTKESAEIQKQALSAMNKVTDPALSSYLSILKHQISIIILDEAMRYLGHEDKRFAEDIAQYHVLRDGIVAEIKANRCCYPPPGWDPAK